MSKLTDMDIQGIMRLRKQDIPNKEIAARFHVSPAAISLAITRQKDRKKTSIIDRRHFIPDPPKPKIQRPPAEYSNQRPFEYRLPVAERRVSR